MATFTKLAGFAALLWPMMLAAQSDPRIAAILERLDRLERENHALTEEVRALRARLDPADAQLQSRDRQGAVPPSTDGTPQASGPSLDEQVQIQGRRIEEQQQTKVEASQRFPIRLTGMALFNAYYNSRQSGTAQYPAVATDPGPRTAGATLRQTILGLDFRGPVTVWGGRVNANVYMDFFSGANTETMRLRTGSIGIDWKSRSVMVGLEKPIFNPREPTSLAQVGISPLTGSGNLWLWLKQARFEQNFDFTRSDGLRAIVGVVQTREAGPYADGGTVRNLEPARPGFEGRFEFFHRFDDERRIEIAPGFHSSTTHVNGFSVASRIFSTDWFFTPIRRVEFSGAFYTGQNVTPLGAGYQQGYGLYYGEAEPVHSTGGWAQLTLHTLPRLDFHFFSGQQDDRNSDLVAGRIGKNISFGGNVYYRLAPNVLVAFEASHLRTFYLSQGLRTNTHYDVALAYLF
jgi:hypothetical protein